MSAVLVEINNQSTLKKYLPLVKNKSVTERHPIRTPFLEEVDNYLKQYPKTQHIDIYLCDLNGHLRGKRIDVSCLSGLAKGCYFPLSIYAMSLDGKVIEETGLGKFIGEPDYLCEPVVGSLQPNPIDPEINAQLLLTMKESEEKDCGFEPRNILKKILKQLHDKNVYPCVSAEIEFYLQPLNSLEQVKETITQCFDINTSDLYQSILNEIEHIAKLQGVQITAIVSESCSGQYEINLLHTDDILKLCDQIMLLKRTIKQIAKKYGLRASFLAKPDMHQAGSGMHFHMSILDEYKNNIFSAKQDEMSEALLKVISGLLLFMPDSMAILAPNLNSFRRFKLGHHVPLEANWDFNNRNVAIRIPCSDQENQRLEYRVAGADCNPYLALATILTGAFYGLTHRLEIPKQANQLKLRSEHVLLPTDQIEALKQLKANNLLGDALGKEFIEVWCTVKQAEYQNVYSQITSIERNWDI